MKDRQNFKSEDTRIWCEYCRIFVYNNRINREKHDSSPQHQSNFKKKIEFLRKQESAKNSPSISHTKSSSNSFYDKSYQNSSLTTESNVLSIKNSNSVKVAKKPLLGLSINNSPKTTNSNEINLSTLGNYEDVKKQANVNASSIKSTVSELKRKSRDDEDNMILNDSEKTGNDLLAEDSPILTDLSSVFKKKKK